jgi:anti-sigma factor RsiW
VNHWEECLSRVDLYLDNELGEGELAVFNRHLKECWSCRKELAEQRRFLERLRAAQPMYAVSPKFRVKMATFLAEACTDLSANPERRRPVTAIAAKRHARSWLLWFWSKPIPTLGACVLAIAGVMILWRLSLREARANAFVDMAAQAHRQELAGHLPLELRTNSPSEISTWFAKQVPFEFRLPTYQETSGQDQRYELTGGKIIAFKGTTTAYIAYRMQSQIISLVVTSASSCVAAGGEKTVSKGLTFHSHRRDELQVVTWSVHNLTYALVSGLNMPARQSCIVCHASGQDRHLIREVKSWYMHEADRNSWSFLNDREIQWLTAFR